MKFYPGDLVELTPRIKKYYSIKDPFVVTTYEAYMKSHSYFTLGKPDSYIFIKAHDGATYFNIEQNFVLVKAGFDRQVEEL